jgi:anti-sigma factor ChrR (cupin superfamily)
MTTLNNDAIDFLLATHAGLIPELTAGGEARKRMLIAIHAKIEARTSMQVVRREQGQWHSIFPGVSIKVLHENTQEHTHTTLWRLQPGASVPRHRHSIDEECLILEGSILHAGTEYFAGDYLLSPKGVPHDQFIAPQGALFLIRGEHLSHDMVL